MNSAPVSAAVYLDRYLPTDSSHFYVVTIAGAADISFHSYKEEREDRRHQSIVAERRPYIQREADLGGLSGLGGLPL